MSMGVEWGGGITSERRTRLTDRERIDHKIRRAWLIGLVMGFAVGVGGTLLADRPEQVMVDKDGQYECRTREAEMFEDCELVTP